MRKSLSYKNSTIEYLVSGSGRQLLFCLHGFGESAASFSILDVLAADYCIVAVALPFHAVSTWNEEQTMEVADLQAILEQIAAQEGADAMQPYTLLGYSMGGRLALSLYENYSKTVERLVLIAPDGMIENFWYRLATQTYWGNRLFSHVMKRPQVFLGIAGWLGRRKWINEGVYRYIMKYLGDASVRETLYSAWTGFRKFRPDLEKIKRIICERHTPVRILYGRYDKVILYKNGERFRKGIEDYCMITIAEAGHILLQPRFATVIKELLMDGLRTAG